MSATGPLRLQCAWCTRVLRDGPEPTSHGICPACRAVYFPRPGPRHVPYVPRPHYRRLTTCPLRRLPVAMAVVEIGGWEVSMRYPALGVC